MFALVDEPCCFSDCCIKHSNIQSVMKNILLYVSSTSLKIVIIIPCKCKFCRLQYFVVIFQLDQYKTKLRCYQFISIGSFLIIYLSRNFQSALK
jgi:hypothetical protein